MRKLLAAVILAFTLLAGVGGYSAGVLARVTTMGDCLPPGTGGPPDC